MDRRTFVRSAGGASLAAALRPAAAQVPAPVPASRTARTERHATAYLEAGPQSGPAIVLIHGWPEIGLAWRHQQRTLASLGFRVIAPDLRGCGRSAAYTQHARYAQREIVRDMVELADAAGIDRAVWVGHDWGASVAWNVARHHPERCHGVAALTVPLDTLERGLKRLSAHVNRTLYPAAEFPAGQYEYVAFYQEHFDDVLKVFDANVENLLKVLLRRGDPAQAGKPFPTANVRRQGGWFGPGMPPPAVPLDRAILDDDTFAAYVEAYRRTGFFGVNSLYMNDVDNDAYAAAAPAGGVLTMPALFLAGRFDYVNDVVGTGLLEPMKMACRQLAIRTLPTGHWMQNERPDEVSASLAGWISGRMPSIWPSGDGG